MAIFSKRKKAAHINHLSEIDEMIETGKPVLIDFMQKNCGPCRIMDGIVNELADEFGDSAHVVKVDVTKVPGAAEQFKVRSTPTFVLYGTPKVKKSKKARAAAKAPTRALKPNPRWRSSGLVKKDQLEKLLVSNGAQRADQSS